MYPSGRLAASFSLVLLSLSETVLFSTADFSSDFNITWGDGRATILDGGRVLQLMMDRYSGSGVESKNEFFFGRFDVQIKLIPGNSSGTIATFYLNSPLQNHDEVDLEFLGNLREDMYILHTNLFASGNGSREHQFRFWFNPTADFHNYTIFWNPKQIIWYVDGTPIRVFKKANSSLVAYPDIQPMKIQASLWDGSDWTKPVDWNQDPFIVRYREYSSKACVWLGNNSASSCGNDASSWLNQEISLDEENKIAAMQKSYMIYSYCNDPKRSSESTSIECSINT